MATEGKPKKSGRTPEQQAARDARKAAKAAAKLAETNAAATEPAVDAPESSAMAQAAQIAAVNEDEGTKSGKKRRRSSAEDAQDGEGEGDEDEDLLEIDVEAPEPLSKAEARAARKRAKKGLPEAPKKAKKESGDTNGAGEADAADSADEHRDTKGRQAETEKRVKKQNSIWIGNLSFRTTPESLTAFLEKGVTGLGGEGEGSVTRLNLPKKAGKGQYAENKGFAYADFATPELQALAVQLSESFFEGRKLLIKLGNDHKETPNALTPKPAKAVGAAILKKQQNPPTSTLFVGNLSFDTTETGLRDFIESNAPPLKETEVADEEVKKEGTDQEDAVEDLDKDRGGKRSGLRKVRLGAFEDSGRCKGFAFLDFHSTEQATTVLTNRKNYTWGGRSLLLQYASEAASKRAGSGPKPSIKREQRMERSLGVKPPARSDRPRPAYPPRTPQVADPPTAFIDVTPASAAGLEFSEPPVTVSSAAEEKAHTKVDKRGKKWEAAGRPRPGAALAMAKREKVGIVEAQGNKITFD